MLADKTLNGSHCCPSLQRNLYGGNRVELVATDDCKGGNLFMPIRGSSHFFAHTTVLSINIKWEGNFLPPNYNNISVLAGLQIKGASKQRCMLDWKCWKCSNSISVFVVFLWVSHQYLCNTVVRHLSFFFFSGGWGGGREGGCFIFEFIGLQPL